MKAFIVLLLSCLTAMSQSYVLRIATNAPSNGDTIVWSGSAWVPSAPSGGGSGTVTNVGLSTSLSGLTVGNSPVTTGGTITLSGTLGLGSGGTGATDAPGARTALSLVPGTDVQAYDVDLAVIAALANSGIVVRTGSGTVAARTITGDSEAVVSNGDGVSGNPTLSIGEAIARDSEVAAGYQPLDSDLTAMAAGTAVATAQTNAVSMGAPVQYVGSTNIAQHLALKAPLASPAFTTSATIGGTNVLDYIASHLTEAEASALYQRTNAILTQLQGLTGGTAGQIVTATEAGTFALSNAPSGGGIWDGTPIASGTITNLTTERIALAGNSIRDWPAGSTLEYADYSTDCVIPDGESSNRFIYQWFGAAIASGTTAVITSAIGDDPSGIRMSSSSTASSGYCYLLRRDAFVIKTNAFIQLAGRFVSTNNSVIFDRAGFLDGTAAIGRGTDGLFLERDGMNVSLVAMSNSVATVSASSYAITSNFVFRARIDVRDAGGPIAADLKIWDSTPTLVATLSLTNGIPITYARATGMGWVSHSTNNVAVPISDIGFMRVRVFINR